MHPDPYLITPEAHTNLFSLFVTRKRHPRSEAMFDGIRVNIITDHPTATAEGLSHALNVLASYYTDPLSAWIDQRTPSQIRQCNNQLQPPPVFQTHKEAAEYKENHGVHTYTAWWSTVLPYDYSDIEDEHGDLMISKTRRQCWLTLTPSTKRYYAWIASFYKMRPPTINNKSTPISLTAAVLEAIGIGWLTPPEGYQQLLHDTPNQNKARIPNPTSKARVKKKYGNPEGTPYVPGSWPPFTQSRAALLRNELEQAGDLPTFATQQE